MHGIRMSKKLDHKTPLYVEPIAAPKTVSVYPYGIVLMLVNRLPWIIMSEIIKCLGNIYSTAQPLLFRKAIAVPVVLVLVLIAGGVNAFKTCGESIHILHEVVVIKC